MTLRVSEIFDSIDGEGLRTGMPCTFIRLAGCNLRCSYCDTLYALSPKTGEYTDMSVEDILAAANTRFMRITLTGGEPLVHPGCHALIDALLRAGFEVNIETNGAADIVGTRNKVYRSERLFFTVDYKLPSSGEEDKMLWSNFINLRKHDVIKFVVGSDEDLEKMKTVMTRILPVYDEMPHVFAGVVYGKYEPVKLVNAIMKEKALSDVRYQIQLHKLIWSPDARGV